MLCSSKEKMAVCIGTKYGNNAAQEWKSGKKIVLQEPSYSQVILGRNAERVMETKNRRTLNKSNGRAGGSCIQD